MGTPRASAGVMNVVFDSSEFDILRRYVMLNGSVRIVFPLLLVCLALPAAAAESRYDELLESPAIVRTVKSIGLAFLALPTERKTIEPQIASV